MDKDDTTVRPASPTRVSDEKRWQVYQHLHRQLENGVVLTEKQSQIYSLLRRQFVPQAGAENLTGMAPQGSPSPLNRGPAQLQSDPLLASRNRPYTRPPLPVGREGVVRGGDSLGTQQQLQLHDSYNMKRVERAGDRRPQHAGGEGVNQFVPVAGGDPSRPHPLEQSHPPEVEEVRNLHNENRQRVPPKGTTVDSKEVGGANLPTASQEGEEFEGEEGAAQPAFDPDDIERRDLEQEREDNFHLDREEPANTVGGAAMKKGLEPSARLPNNQDRHVVNFDMEYVLDKKYHHYADMKRDPQVVATETHVAMDDLQRKMLKRREVESERQQSQPEGHRRGMEYEG